MFHGTTTSFRHVQGRLVSKAVVHVRQLTCEVAIAKIKQWVLYVKFCGPSVYSKPTRSIVKV